MSKYKVGDKVLIREDLEVSKYYGSCSVVPRMKKYLGQIATIERIDIDGDYEIDLDDKEWSWTEEMIEKLVEEKEETFEVGDLVKIREDLRHGNDFEIYVNKDMLEFKGKVGTIIEKSATGSFVLDVDKGEWRWTQDMMKKIKDYDGEELVDILRVIKDGDYYVSKCNNIVLFNSYGKFSVLGIEYKDLPLNMRFKKVKNICLKDLLNEENINKSVIAILDGNVEDISIDNCFDLIFSDGENVNNHYSIKHIVDGVYLL